MNYFFVHLGRYPYWLKDSIESVKISDRNAKIYLCGDSNEIIDGVNNLDLKDIISDLTKESMKCDLWKSDPNPLWRTSIYRIFILLDMMKALNVEKFVHFDSDVILFEPFENAKKSINQDIKGLHITPCNNSEVVFGYSYCNDLQSLYTICNLVLTAIYDNNFLNFLIDSHPNEMQILGGINKRFKGLISELPTIPSDNLEYVFDPSSYGQYLFGTHNGYGAGWYGNHHRIGKLIGETKLSVRMDGKPIVNNSKIVNLHIHSKKTANILKG